MNNYAIVAPLYSLCVKLLPSLAGRLFDGGEDLATSWLTQVTFRLRTRWNQDN